MDTPSRPPFNDNPETSSGDTFWLHDLRIDVVTDGRPMTCSHHEGEAFTVEGEDLVFSKDTRFSLYALAALLPLLPAKQRVSDPNDWMSTDDEVACPDPHCGARFRIVRTARRAFRHALTTGLPGHRER
tara:strand:- start:239 stop:625 length:387 start_codon:yes stop_codon:yes gene_type:complete